MFPLLIKTKAEKTNAAVSSKNLWRHVLAENNLTSTPILKRSNFLNPFLLSIIRGPLVFADRNAHKKSVFIQEPKLN